MSIKYFTLSFVLLGTVTSEAAVGSLRRAATRAVSVTKLGSLFKQVSLGAVRSSASLSIGEKRSMVTWLGAGVRRMPMPEFVKAAATGDLTRMQLFLAGRLKDLQDNPRACIAEIHRNKWFGKALFEAIRCKQQAAFNELYDFLSAVVLYCKDEPGLAELDLTCLSYDHLKTDSSWRPYVFATDADHENMFEEYCRYYRSKNK